MLGQAGHVDRFDAFLDQMPEEGVENEVRYNRRLHNLKIRVNACEELTLGIIFTSSLSGRYSLSYGFNICGDGITSCPAQSAMPATYASEGLASRQTLKTSLSAGDFDEGIQTSTLGRIEEAIESDCGALNSSRRDIRRAIT